jgi:nucleoid DNA-binding protein
MSLQYEVTRELSRQGIPKAKARKGYQKVFQAIGQALGRGESVQTPAGTFEVVPETRRRQKRVRFGKIVTLFRKRKKVVLRPIGIQHWEDL